MTIDTVAQEYLDRLKKGEEIFWDYLLNMVKEGIVKQADARSSLRKCLEIVIPQYTIMFQQGDRDYWGLRLTEALTAREYIDSGLPAKFRGIIL